ncbi:MAG: hypothetical protein NTX52_11540 [Planctomycetota bacterium]|nr:hypothetical protein [Planctomycetota bacterium]
MDVNIFDTETIMGERIMFDLNEQVKKWRRTLAQSEAFGKSDIDELESHLREEVERLMALKLSGEEAFWVAEHRVGDTGTLAGEFAKVNWAGMLRRRLFWMAAGVLAYLLASYFAIAASQVCVLLAGLNGVRGYGLGAVGVLSNLAILGLAVLPFCLACRHNWNIMRFNRWLDNSIIRTTLFVGLIATVVVLNAARFFLPAIAARIMGVQEYGQMAIVWAYLQLLIPVLLAVILIVVLFKLRTLESDVVAP